MLVARGLLDREEEAPRKCDEQNADEHDGTAERREFEKFEWLVTVEDHRLGNQEVRGGTDQRHQATEQGCIGERHEQPGRGQARAARNLDNDRQHERGNADVVHEGRQDRGRHHDHHDHRKFAFAANSHDLTADNVGNAGACQAFAENKHGPHGDDGAITESGECLGRIDEAGDGERAEHEQRDDVHPYDLADEQHQRNDKNAKHQCDFEVHVGVIHDLFLCTTLS